MLIPVTMGEAAATPAETRVETAPVNRLDWSALPNTIRDLAKHYSDTAVLISSGIPIPVLIGSAALLVLLLSGKSGGK